jgi:long-subunit fatty acid transport protein
MPAAALAIAALTVPSAAQAGSAKFASASASVAANGALVASFDERGLGNENVDYLLTAHAEATFGCINGGANHPQAANKETISSEVSAAASIEPKNGRVVASIKTTAPPPGGFSWPSGQKLAFGGVSYSDIVLADTTNGSSVSLPDVSKTYVAF